MNPIIKNILAIIAGWLIGSLINFGLVQVGHIVLPIEGVDPSDMDALAKVMPTLGSKYFIFPFLAHATGTLFGAYFAFKLAANNKMKIALGIGLLFFFGGIMVSYMLPAPTWFIVVDIALAYFPMAYIGGKLAEGKKNVD